MPLSRSSSLLVAFSLIAAASCGSDSVVNPPPSRVTIAIASGNNQSATVGNALPAPLTVSLTDDHGPVAGQAVQWTVTSGNGTLSANSVSTDATGHASVTWTLGPDVGNQAVAASVGNFGVGFAATAGAIQPPPPSPKPLVLHFDGVSWAPSYQSTSLGLQTVWGASASDVFAGGLFCSPPNSSMLLYSGSSWSFTAPCGTVGTVVTSISGNGPSDVFALERTGLIQAHYFLVHYDGQMWTTVYTHPSSPNADLRAIGARASNDVIAVGSAGTIVRYDGTTWGTQASGTTANLVAVWGDRASPAVFAAGSSGAILYYDGSAWHAQTSGTTEALYAIWGISASDVFAAGASGTILHYDGTSWSARNSGTTHALRGLWGNSASSVFAVGDDNTILHFDGTSWTPQDPGSPIDLASVWGSSSTNVFAVGVPR